MPQYRIFPREFDELYARALGNDRREMQSMHVHSNLLLRLIYHYEIMSAMCAINALSQLQFRVPDQDDSYDQLFNDMDQRIRELERGLELFASFSKTVARHMSNVGRSELLNIEADKAMALAKKTFGEPT